MVCCRNQTGRKRVVWRKKSLEGGGLQGAEIDATGDLPVNVKTRFVARDHVRDAWPRMAT